VRTPKLTAGYAIGPAFGRYRAAPSGGPVAALAPMACAEDEIECPDDSNCCTANQVCIYDRDNDTYTCRNIPPARPPTPEPAVPAPGTAGGVYVGA
jgi:hypothetical protein